MVQKRSSIFRRNAGITLLLLSALLIRFVAMHPLWIENYYLPFIYLPVAAVMRFCFGWLPFSLGDILYALAGGMLLLNLISFIKKIVRKEISVAFLKYKLKRTIVIILSIYIYFNISWGLNYNRLGIAYQLKLQPQQYSVEDLKVITDVLIVKVNTQRSFYPDSIIRIPAYRKLYGQSVETYKETKKQFPFLSYEYRSIKKSNYGRLGNYLGFLGYYNPFTGEAQLNLTIPRFVIPFVTCHEMAHQLGYASESEANFVGYLAAVHSTNPLYHYSAYFDMLQYANIELARRDTMAARLNVQRLSKHVKGDMRQVIEFDKKTKNVLEPVIAKFYDFYLKANQQEKGVRSYNEVVGWMIAYYKKYGSI